MGAGHLGGYRLSSEANAGRVEGRGEEEKLVKGEVKEKKQRWEKGEGKGDGGVV